MAGSNIDFTVDIDSDEVHEVEYELEKGAESNYDVSSDTDDDSFTTSEGDYVASIRNIPLLTREEEVALAKRAEKGDKSAQDELITHNLKLVLYLANSLRSKTTIPFMDLVQEGNLGLIKAATKYRLSKNVKFSTYAGVCALRSMQRSIYNDEKLIHVPVNKSLKARMANAILGRIEAETGEKITGSSDDALIERLASELKLSVKQTREILKISRMEPISLATPIHQNESKSVMLLEDIVPDDSGTPSDIAEESIATETLYKCLDDLTERERAVIERRFGLAGREVETLEAIGNDLGLTRERVRQIQSKAIRKISTPQNKRVLASLFGYRLEDNKNDYY